MVVAQRESVANIAEASHQSLGQSCVGHLADNRFGVPNSCYLIDGGHATIQCSVVCVGATMSVKNRQETRGTHRERVINAALISGKHRKVGIHHGLPFRTHSRPPPRIDAMNSPIDQFDFTITAIADSCVGISQVDNRTQPTISPTNRTQPADQACCP